MAACSNCTPARTRPRAVVETAYTRGRILGNRAGAHRSSRAASKASTASRLSQHSGCGQGPPRSWRSVWMESFLVSVSTVAIAEMGDRTQLLSLMLAAHYRRPWPILAGVLCATLANHAVAGLIGARLGRFLTPTVLDAGVGVSMIAMALWTLKPDTLTEGAATTRRTSAFVATLVAFFIAE